MFYFDVRYTYIKFIKFIEIVYKYIFTTGPYICIVFNWLLINYYGLLIQSFINIK